MYSKVKFFVKKILPQKFLFENEESLRKILLPVYQGKNCKCNICETNLDKFVTLSNGNLLCPICGSLPRTRRLWEILNQNFLKKTTKILDFSPSRAIYRKLKKNREVEYFPTDFENQFLADYQYDITEIDVENDSFDLIICYHILEHIVEDSKAMSELFRVLKQSGTCLIQTLQRRKYLRKS